MKLNPDLLTAMDAKERQGFNTSFAHLCALTCPDMYCIGGGFPKQNSALAFLTVMDAKEHQGFNTSFAHLCALSGFPNETLPWLS